MQAAAEFVGNGNAAARQGENESAGIVPIRFELGSQQTARFFPISEDHRTLMAIARYSVQAGPPVPSAMEREPAINSPSPDDSRSAHPAFDTAKLLRRADACTVCMCFGP